MGLIIALVVIAVLFVAAIIIVPEVQAMVLSFFNTSPVQFVDITPLTVILQEGETRTITVNVENNSNQQFSDLRLDYKIGNHNNEFLTITPHEFQDDRLLTKGDRTGNTPIDITAIKLIQGDEATYWGEIQLYSGDKLMDTKPIKIVIRG